MTHYYELRGQLYKDNELVTDKDEYTEIFDGLMSAMIDSKPHQFVDVSLSGTISEGRVTLDWSDYGLDKDNPT